MDDNISKAVEYIQQHPNEPIETLVQNLINSGYTNDAIKSALERLGTSPLVIPGYQETMEPSHKSGLNLPRPILFVALGGILLIVAVVYAAMSTKKANTAAVQPEENKVAVVPSSTESTPVDEISGVTPLVTRTAERDLLATSKESFYAGDYKITVRSLYDGQESGALDYYTQKGTIVMIQHLSGTTVLPSDPNIKLILRSNEAILLNGNEKQYITYAYPNGSADRMVDYIKYSFQPTYIFKQTWQKTSDFSYTSPVDSSEKAVINFAPGSGYLSSYKVYNGETVGITYEFTFQRITITPEIVSIPSDYTAADSLSPTP